MGGGTRVGNVVKMVLGEWPGLRNAGPVKGNERQRGKQAGEREVGVREREREEGRDGAEAEMERSRGEGGTGREKGKEDWRKQREGLRITEKTRGWKDERMSE